MFGSVWRSVIAVVLVAGCSDDDDQASTSGYQGPGHGPCEIYVECVSLVDAEEAASADAYFGEMGSCWTQPSITEAECWGECLYYLEEYRESHPNADVCQRCEDDDDCPEESACTQERCTASAGARSSTWAR